MDSNDVGINKRRFQIEVISTDYYGRQDTGILFYLNLNNKSPDVTGCTVSVGGTIQLNLQSTKTTGLVTAEIYGSTDQDFRIDEISGYSNPAISA